MNDNHHMYYISGVNDDEYNEEATMNGQDLTQTEYKKELQALLYMLIFYLSLAGVTILTLMHFK